MLVNGETKKRIGRPPVPESERKNRTIPFRCRDALYEMLVDASAGSGRTMSQEIEQRLLHSFQLLPPERVSYQKHLERQFLDADKARREALLKMTEAWELAGMSRELTIYLAKKVGIPIPDELLSPKQPKDRANLTDEQCELAELIADQQDKDEN
jgi:hypothetical protein